MYGVDGRKFQRQYKKSISNFTDWDQKSHAEDWILYPENISERLSLDEVALSDGELYTILTSKKGKGRKGSIVAVIKGTQSNIVAEYILKVSRRSRMRVKEITIDMAGSMKLIAKRCFPNATQVIDRFHVQKLAIEALQELRIGTVGKLLNKKIFCSRKPKKIRKILKLNYLRTATPGSSSWQEADIYSIKPEKNGLRIRFKELKFCSPIILI